jgi:hypothetical protein
MSWLSHRRGSTVALLLVELIGALFEFLRAPGVSERSVSFACMAEGVLGAVFEAVREGVL